MKTGKSPESTFCNTQVAEAPCTTFNCFVPALLQSGTGEPRHDIPLYSLPIRLTVVKIRPVSSPYRRLPRYIISAPLTLIPCERIPAFPSLLPQPLSLRKTLKTQRFKIRNIRWSLLHKTIFNAVLMTSESRHLRVTSRPSAVSGRADIALIRPRGSSELPASVACRSTAAPVRPRCPETLVLGSSKKADVCARAAKMRGQAKHGRSQKGCCLIAMLFMHPCMKSGTFSLRNRASGPPKFFRELWRQVRLCGAARLSRAPKNARCSAKARASCSSQVLLRSCRRIPGASMLKSTCTDFGGGGLLQAVGSLPFL